MDWWFEYFYCQRVLRENLHCRLCFFNSGVHLFNWQTLWNIVVPSKVSFLAWLLVGKRVLTHDNLQRRGFRLASRCFLCNLEREDSDYLFISCQFSNGIWEYFCINGAQRRLLHLSFEERLCKWNGIVMSKQGSLLWNLLPHAIC